MEGTQLYLHRRTAIPFLGRLYTARSDPCAIRSVTSQMSSGAEAQLPKVHSCEE